MNDGSSSGDNHNNGGGHSSNGNDVMMEPELFFGQLGKFLKSFDTTKTLIVSNLLKSKLSRPKIDYHR